MSWVDVIVVIAVIVAGPVLGSIAAAIVRKLIGAPSRPEALRNSSKPISSLFFWLFIVISLIVVLGIFRPSTVDKLADDFVNFIPKVLVAAIILIGANVLSTFAVTAIGPALARMPLDIQQKVMMVVRAVIIAFAVLLAVTQIGIDTEIINMAVASILFSIAASLALLVGLGGNSVAKQVAASRSLKRIIEPQDQITVGDISGKVDSVGPTHITIRGAAGTVSVPSSDVLNGNYKLKKGDA